MVDLLCLTSVCYLPWMRPDPPQCHLCKYIYINVYSQRLVSKPFHSIYNAPVNRLNDWLDKTVSNMTQKYRRVTTSVRQNNNACNSITY